MKIGSTSTIFRVGPSDPLLIPGPAPESDAGENDARVDQSAAVGSDGSAKVVRAPLLDDKCPLDQLVSLCFDFARKQTHGQNGRRRRLNRRIIPMTTTRYHVPQSPSDPRPLQKFDFTVKTPSLDLYPTVTLTLALTQP